MGKNSPSLRDVTRITGVLLGTASRALNNKSSLLPTTRVVPQAAAQFGYKLRVPDDISVMGFDDKAVTVDSPLPLTTMRVEKELMGALGVRQLHERAVNHDCLPITAIIGTRLLVRESVSPVVCKQGELA